MSVNDDRQLTPEERAQISKRKLEMNIQKKSKQATLLSDLKKELGIPEKGKRK